MPKYRDYTNDPVIGCKQNSKPKEIKPKEIKTKKVEPEVVEVADAEIVLEMPVVRVPSLPENWMTDEKLLQLQKWGEEGLSYDLIARNMGISRNMLQRWRNEHYEIDEAILLGREVATGKVEEALFKKCTGYYVTKTVVDAKGEEHDIREYIQPDIKAIQYYLNNRCKERWSGNIQHQTNIQVPIFIGEGGIKD